MSPSVLALIVNYNGATDTIECLDSLSRLEYAALRVLILDNGSTDESLTRLRQWAAATAWSRDRVEIVALGTNRGFAGANNVGLRRVLAGDAELGWLLNNDTIVAPDALRHMVAAYTADHAIGAVGATLLRYDARDRVETAGGGSVAEWHGMTRTVHTDAPRSAPRPTNARLDFISGTCMLVSRSTLARVGLMDERYFLYGEDIDWGIRMREHGLRLAYCADAEVWHKGGGTTVHKSAIHDYYNVKSSLLLVHKRRPAMLPLAMAYSVARCLVPKLARGEWRRVPPVVRGYVDFARQVVRGAEQPVSVAGS